MKVKYGIDLSPLEKELETLLANFFSLYVKTLNFHWNLEDPRFLSLHEMFGSQYEALVEGIDELAEKMKIMGFFVKGSLNQFQKSQTLKEVETQLSGDEMIENLASDYETLIDKLRELIRKAEGLGDPGFADWLTGKVQNFEKTAWMLRSHL